MQKYSNKYIVEANMLAVLESGNKQYHVAVGDIILVDRLEGDVGQLINLDRVMSIGDKIGSPLLANAMVQAEIIEQKKHDKVIVFKKKRRHNYRRKKGHRQQISVLRIKDIIA